MLAFSVTSFFFVSSIFSKSIFAIGIPKATTPYCFCVSFALLFRTFVQPFSSLNFSTSSILFLYIAISLLSRVCAAQSLVVVILFSIKYASILCTTFSEAYFLISSAKTLLLSFTTISFFLL